MSDTKMVGIADAVKPSSENANSSKKAAAKQTLGKDAFLQLLVAQMRYQDPLSPTDNTQYVSQLATFSQVEELQNLAIAASGQRANDLMGKTVVMKTETATGETAYVGGVVERVVSQDGKTYLGLNGSLYNLDDLDSIVSEDFYKKYYLPQGSTTPSGGTEVEGDKKTDDADKTVDKDDAAKGTDSTKDADKKDSSEDPKA